MTRNEFQKRLAGPYSRLWVPSWSGTVTDWAEQTVRFNEPERVGNFSTYQREYLREMLDVTDAATDVVICAGTRTGKTTVLYSAVLYKLMQRAVRGLYVKPTTNGPAGAKNDAKTRFLPMCRASSEQVAAMIPSGALRHNWTTGQQIFLNGSILEWVGSNSVAQLASNPCQLVAQDETDKFNATRRRDDDGTVIEADAGDLADERTGEAIHPLRIKASTPTLTTGRIWQNLLNTDLRRRFMPCPLCGRHHPRSRLVVLAWSEHFTVLPKQTWYKKALPLAYAQWDKEAKRADGTWDLARVERSAGYLCPHCRGRFTDQDKTWMDANGVWLPTRRNTSGAVGFHLPSMYAAHPSTTAGSLAVEFLESLRSPEGPRNIINSKLAEPYTAQESSRRIEIVSRIEVMAEWQKILSVDCQAVSPYFWFILRAFGGKEIVGLKGGPLESWEDVEGVQNGDKVPDVAVVIDSGWGAKDNAEIYRVCGQHGQLIPDPKLGRLRHVGWLPAKGMPGRSVWRNPETGLYVPWYFRPIDYYQGTTDAGKVRGDLFEFASDEFQDQLERLRKNKAADFHWTIADALDTPDYHHHMNGDCKDPNGKWIQRHRQNHLRDCEKQCVAFASALGYFTLPDTTPDTTKV